MAIDPEFEYSPITRIDFNLFCRFDGLGIPVPESINRQLTKKGLKVEKVSAAIIQTAGDKQSQAIEADDEGRVGGQTTPGKDSDARWIKKSGRYKPGYKQHTRADEEGHIGKPHITPAEGKTGNA